MNTNNRTLQDYLSLGYLFLILCGLAKDIILYRFIGVNILDYSSISDVLLSPIIYIGENYIAAAIIALLYPMMYYSHDKDCVRNNLVV